ncbi:LysR family transcriptional regulator [Granulosicoccaceae sp. 1_MG-2023]|nr:LysR family transcriptional regulator [Granulosicoccaceae sp. 1_MG-2023]
MELNNLRAFLAVAESRSFSAAAEQLHLTQPAVSKRIAALEDSLASALFDRVGRKTLLTEAGRALLPVARNVIGELNRVQDSIARLGTDIGGRLSIATSHHIGLHRLPPVLREFTRRYPEVELDLHFMDSEDALAAVDNSAVELAVVTLPQASLPSLNIEPLWHDELVLVTDPEHPLQRLDKPCPDDLARWPAIVPSRETVTRQILDQALLPFGVRLKVAMETNYIETIKMLVSVGLGWGSLPVIMLDDSVRRLAMPELTPTRELGVAHHKRRRASAAGEAFRDILYQHRQRR